MDSRLIVLHDHGYLENYATLERDGNGWICPNGNQHHQPGHAEYCCTGVLYEVVEPLVDDHREMPSFAYQARSTPAGMTPQFASAFIASFPLTRLVVVNGHKAQHRRDQIATQTSVLVEVVEQ